MEGPTGAVISEIMYHPVAEVGPVEEHEFVEIANRGNKPLPLAGWQLKGAGVTFTFPMGAQLPANGYLVVAKSPQKVAEVWGLKAMPLGPYDGELDNGGGKLTLSDAKGTTSDEVRYDRSFPWPVGADAFGASAPWLAAELLPLEKHKFKGRSLERVAIDLPSQELTTWAPSPVDGATPGGANSAAGKVQALVESVTVAPKGGSGPVRSKDEVLVQVKVSARGTLTAPAIDYYVDDIDKADEPHQMVPLTKAGDAWQATLPMQADNSIVRYRVVGDRGDGMGPIAPRPSDPYPYFAYFVGPDLPGKSLVYQLFISKANWSQLWKNILAWRVPQTAGKYDCKPNPTWDDKVPAVLVFNGQVVDVQARYQGSPYNRQNGPDASAYPTAKAPDQPKPLRALSWHFSMPRYAPLEGGKRDVTLIKRANECSFFTTHVSGRLFESVGIPAPRVWLARLYVNGSYLHFYAEYEHPDGEMLKRVLGKGADQGDYFKVVGWNGEQGPYTWSDGRELTAACGYSVEERYNYNYDRVTPDWKTGAAEVQKLITDLNAAKKTGPEALKAFYEQTFDMTAMMNYMAMINWMGPWDDFFQNEMLYRKTDGKWMMTPWDFDNFFGGYVKATDSFYVGELNDRSNRVLDNVKWVNYIKDGFLKSFRDDFHARLQQLSTNELEASKVNKLIDDLAATYDSAEAKPSASKAACEPAAMITRMKTFTRDRNDRVSKMLFK